jgi:hypothetical protein
MITAGHQLPVCLQGDRLVFLVDSVCQVEVGSVVLTLQETAGSSWDGATIPRVCWSVIGHPLTAEFRWASLWHDRLCEQTDTIEQRGFADAVFLELLRQSGVGFARRWAMWLAVRIYGIILRG